MQKLVADEKIATPLSVAVWQERAFSSRVLSVRTCGVSRVRLIVHSRALHVVVDVVLAI